MVVVVVVFCEHSDIFRILPTSEFSPPFMIVTQRHRTSIHRLDLLPLSFGIVPFSLIEAAFPSGFLSRLARILPAGPALP